jgi:hypothetical protein
MTFWLAFALSRNYLSSLSLLTIGFVLSLMILRQQMVNERLVICPGDLRARSLELLED